MFHENSPCASDPGAAVGVDVDAGPRRDAEAVEVLLRRAAGG